MVCGNFFIIYADDGFSLMILDPRSEILQGSINFADFLTLEDRTDRSFRNVGTELPLNAA
jgi:hypothetical protein